MAHISLQEVEHAFPEFDVLPEFPSPGGQKSVFFININGQIAALKILHIPLTGDSEDDRDAGHYPERIRREVEALRNLNSPYLAEILRAPEERLIGENQHLWYLEPKYGRDLHRRLEVEGRLDVSELCSLIDNLLNAELTLSENGLVHRDIKPLNVLENPHSGNWVLIDLGVALHVDLPRLTEITHTRTTMFAAPEQFDRIPIVDHRTDIYQIGLTAYIAATMTHPFLGAPPNPTLAEYQDRLSQGVSVEPLMAAGLPIDLAKFIQRSMGARPNRRFRTVEAAFEAFQVACK